MAMLKAPKPSWNCGSTATPSRRTTVSAPATYGYPHFCLLVDGIEAEYGRLSAAGMEFAGPPVNFGGSSAIYGKDPFGNVIELYEIRDPHTAQLDR